MQELDGVRAVGRNRKWDGFVTVIVLVAVIRTQHGDPMIASFVGLQRAEARLIKKYKK